MLILISNPFSLFSSHLIGGKITYRYLGANKYEIKLTVYRDCSDNVPFDNPAYVTIYNKLNNSLIYNKGLALLSTSVIPANPPNPCFVPPTGICVEIGTYVDTVQLSNNANGYCVSYQRCCHNSSVLNLVLPQTNGMTITTDIPPQINNSPQFINFPPIYICLSDTFNYSFASTDTDGDNLIYQLCTPFNGGGIGNFAPNPASPPPYNPLTWSAGFSATNPIPNNGGFNLNSSTGQLKFKPSMVGQFAIGICVLEYRNNVLINTNRLELQFNIVNCYLTSSIPTATNLCEGLTINFQNSSTNANSFHWNFGDLTTLADTSNLFTPTYIYPTYGTYTVTLTVFNTAYGFCKDSSKKVINVNPLLSPTLQTTYSDCYKNNNFSFIVGGTFHPSANFNWNFTPNSNSPNSNINPASAHFTTPNTKTISVIVNQFGCKDTLYATVSFTNPVASLNENYLNCWGLTPFLGSTSQNATSLFWDFGDPTSTTDTSSQISPVYTYPNYGNYTITLVATNGVCKDTLKYPANISPVLNILDKPFVQEQCLNNNNFNFNVFGQFPSNTIFNWTFPDQPVNQFSSVQNPNNITFQSAGIKTITINVSANGCVRTATQTAIVNKNPKINSLISDTSGCEPLTIKFKNNNDSLHPVNHLWNINGNSFNADTVDYFFLNSGVYSYNLVITDTNNCKDSISKINHIKVFPKPIVKSFVTPYYSSILDPRITFIDSTQLNHNTYYSFGDGATSTQTNTIHSYQSANEYNYFLIVTNENGCSDTASGIIYIDDIPSNYVPNIFTPNGDGVNDNFFIKGKNITSSSMQIINRWGTTVFDSNDALTGWNGINQNNNTAAVDGVYFYIIEITLGNNRTYKFNGNVTLIK